MSYYYFFLNNFGRLEPFSTVAWLLIEIKLWSLDPFRKMFKHQKTLFRGITNLQKFYSRCIIGCYVIIRKKSENGKKWRLEPFGTAQSTSLTNVRKELNTHSYPRQEVFGLLVLLLLLLLLQVR